MAHIHDAQPTAPPLAGALPPAALRLYLPADLAAELLDAAPSPRAITEAFAHLAAARYAISTYLPHHLVERQLATDDAGPWLEWVEGSLLFADVSGSTALAERLTALGREGTEIVTGALNDFFDTMIQIIQAAGGDLLTFGGDALLVLFSGARHAHVATRAALDLLRDLSGYQRSVPGIGTFSLSMHIGVESGRVALASAGHPGSLRYSALGSTVNSVARAESYGGKGELVVGPGAWPAIAADAEGVEVVPGYVRVTALHARPEVTPVSQPLGPPAAPPLEAIPLLLRQLDRISPYLPAGLLARILVEPQRPRVEADLRPVTVLFAQFVGLGPLVEALDPARAAAVLDAFLYPLQAAIERYGGVVNKLDLADEGDKLLAIFGAPVAYEDHAERAARAALEMIARLEDAHLEIQQILASEAVRAKHPRSGHATPQDSLPTDSSPLLRIGLNTGSVFAGNVGTTERKEYTVMGDAVNVAARVMVKTPWGEVWCSAATAAQISARLVCEDRGLVVVKGKSEPLRLLRVAGERATAPAPALDEAPLVGRRADLAWLLDQLEAARRGQGRTVRISGEAGIGKSRLTAALVEHARAAGVRVLAVACLSYATNTPYAPWSELIKSLCGIESGDSQATRATRLRAALQALDGDALEWLPLLADLVRLDVAEPPIIRALDPQQRQTRRFELITDLLRHTAQHGRLQLADYRLETAAADQAPISDLQSAMLILFEDLHWADQVSLDLWQYVAAHIDDVPVLLLGVHRPQLMWGSGPQGDDAHVLALSELPLSDSEALIEARLGGMALPPGIREQIVARAGGNPLFLEELLRAVASAAINGEVSSDLLETLPDSLNGLLLARIDRLDETSRSLLRMASVIGQRFPFGVLQSIHPADQQALLRQLSKLDSQALTVLEREMPERVHLFRHALLQEVAYQSLLYARRRELHRRIGEYLERRYAAELVQLRAQYSVGDGKAPLVQIGRNGALLRREARIGTGPLFLLAHHYRLSDSPAKAIAYLLLAGHAARDDYANDEAIQYYRWALEALRDQPADPRTWEAREALGDMLCTIGRYDEAIAEYDAILTPEGEPGSWLLPPAVAAEVLRSKGDALEKQGHYAAAFAALEQAETIVRAHLDEMPPLMLPAIYADMGLVLMRRGEYDQSLAICTEGLSKVRNDRRSAEDERIEADLHRQLGTIYGMRGDYANARFHFENALAAQEAIDDLYGCSRSHNNIGFLWQLQSNYEQAVAHYTQAEELARKINAKFVLSSACLNAAYAYYRLADYDRAEADCRAALALCEEMGEQHGIASSHETLGIIAYSRGRYDEALASYERALALNREIGGSYEEGNTLANMAAVYNARRQPHAAARAARQALAIAERLQMPQLRVEALNCLAEADLLAATTDPAQPAADADPDEAMAAPPPPVLLARSAEQAGQAAALAEELGSKFDYGIARRILGQVAACLRQPCEEHFQASIAVFTEINNRFELARSQAAYAEALKGCNPGAAAAYLKVAQETFQEIGALGEIARLVAASERSIQDVAGSRADGAGSRYDRRRVSPEADR